MTTVQHRKSSAVPTRQSDASKRERDGRAEDAHLDALLDDALAATFPASDPIALPAPPD